MAAGPETALTIEEYLAFERDSETKHEYGAGEVFAMAGGSFEHNLIVMNAYASLHAQLRGRPYRVLPSNMRVLNEGTGLFTYPDLTVISGQPRFLEAYRPDTLLNPTVIVEVLSPSTEGYDRGKKFQHYRTIRSLQEYLLIAQDDRRIEHYLRREDGFWLLSEAVGAEERVELPTIGCTLALADVYENVALPEGEPGTASRE